MEKFIHERSSVIYHKNKANWMEYGDEYTEFFFDLQHRNVTKQNVMKHVTNDGVTHGSPNDILKEEVKNMFSFQSPPSPLS